MQAAGYVSNLTRVRGITSVLPGIALMSLAVIIALFALLITGGSFESYPFLFLVPWLTGLAVVMLIPSAILYYLGKFSFTNPIVFATFSYFFPAFVVGGLFFAFGLSEPSFISLIQDAHYTLPLTVALIALGFAGLSAGFMLPFGSKLGTLVAKRLPTADYPSNSFLLPGVLLLLSGVMNSFIALVLGRFGYQRAEEISSYDGIVFLTTMFWVQGSFLLWLIIFRQKRWQFVYVPVIALLAATGISKFLFSGSRATVISIFLIITFAFILSGRKFKFKHGVMSAVFLTVGLLIGMVYGTTFRNIKGSEERQSAGEYTQNIFLTMGEVGNTDVYESASFGVSGLTERIDILSTLGVVVSSYEQLKPYEEAYGLDDNIWVDMTTFMIPRVLWEDKPVASDARKYSDLYFSFSGSSYAITPVGDLLRNYGIIGVPIGMFMIGLCLRFIYRALVEKQTPVLWRLTLYFMLLTSISYEGFYGTIFPTLFKAGITAIIGILFVTLTAKRINTSRMAAQLRV